MALDLETTTANLSNAPSGYTPPSTSHTFTDKNSVKDNYSVAITGLSGATSTAGITSVVSAVDTYISGTFIPTNLGIDVSGNTVDAICTIISISRGNNSDSIFLNEANDTFDISFTLDWEVS